MAENDVLTPTRRLLKAERDIFERVRAGFVHLTVTDAEQLTQYAEAAARYESAQRETKRHPTVSIPVVNRRSGNIVGEKIIRNPVFITQREALAQLTTLARRLLIDAHSAEKRQRLLTKKARALAASEHAQAADAARSPSEAEIVAEMQEVAKLYVGATPAVLRQEALWRLTVFAPMMAEDENDPELAHLFA